MAHLRSMTLSFLGVALLGCATSAPQPVGGVPRDAAASAGQKPRVVVTADPELDDSNSLLRYLLYFRRFHPQPGEYRARGAVDSTAFARAELHASGAERIRRAHEMVGHPYVRWRQP
jgi:hypothetical protein